MNTISNVALLVHGTWARAGFLKKRAKAAWCEIESALSQELIGHFGPSLAIETLEWSGDNSVYARIDASHLMDKKLAELRDRYPGAAIHIVAHSHGGNVAMYSLRRKKSQDQVGSLVCLSTPFLHATERKHGTDFLTTLRDLTLVFLGLFIAVLGMTMFGNTLPNFDMLHFLFGNGLFKADAAASLPGTASELSVLKDGVTSYGLFVAIVAFSLLVSSPALGQKYLDRMRARAKKLSDEMKLPDSLPFPVLIVRARADEASSFLGIFQLLTTLFASLTHKLVKWLSNAAGKGKLGKRVSIVFMGGYVLMFLGVCLMLLAGLLDTHLIGFSQTLTQTGGSVMLIGCAVLMSFTLGFFAIALTSWIAGGLNRLMLMTYGWELFGFGQELQVTAEASPAGPWTVDLLRPSDEYDENRGSPHGTHSSRAALDHIRGWLKKNVDAPAVESKAT